MTRTNVFVIFLLLMLGLQKTCAGCGRPPVPPNIPCIGFAGNSLVLQLGSVFQTNSVSQCSAGIGLLGSPPGLNFSLARIGVQDTLNNNFTQIFTLNRFAGADSTWAAGAPGPDINGTQPLPGATWFGFSNINVPPVTPPLLLPHEFYAIEFIIQGPFVPSQIEGLKIQYGSGAATSLGLPDFNHVADLAHSAQYALAVNVPAFGTSNWVPEPSSSMVYLVLAITIAKGMRYRRTSAVGV